MAKLMADAAAMQTEASNRGNEKVYRSAGSLATGLCTAKEFARYLRDHSKNKQPFGKCVELADPAAATAKWLAQQLQMQPSASFMLLALKAGFVQQFLVVQARADCLHRASSTKMLQLSVQFSISDPNMYENDVSAADGVFPGSVGGGPGDPTGSQSFERPQ